MFNSSEYLNTFTNWEPRLDKAGVSSFSVDRMEALLKVFRHPESSLLFAHVAGSKGKGSTSAFLAYILRAAGYRVGLYTSPHLYSVYERIRVLEPGVHQDDPFEGVISLREFDERISFYKDDIDRLRASGTDVTYYELMTALAVSHFASKNVKAVVLETGLGGRLDATNAFETSVCGITPIGLEHTSILGETLPLIAAEKAAIIKSPSQRAAFSPQAPEAMRVLKARAESFYIHPTVVGQEMPVHIVDGDVNGVRFNVSGRREYYNLKTRLLGEHQAYNAALAIAMAEDLETYGLVITEDAVSRGVAETYWPGRFEVFPGKPVVVVDSAHTPESAMACVRAFKNIFPGQRAVILFGSSVDKNINGVCQALLPVAGSVVATKVNHPRASGFTNEQLSGLFPSIDSVFIPDVASAKAEALRQAGEDGIILAVGSVFLAAEVAAGHRRLIKKG